MKLSSGKIHRHVLSIFYLYLGAYYLFPFIMNLFYSKEYGELYVGTDSNWPVVYVVFLVALIFLFNTFLPRVKLFSYKNIGAIFENKLFNSIVILIFLISSIQFSLNYSLNFRQSSAESISGAGGYVMVMFGLRSYVKVFFLYLILKYANDLEITRNQRYLTGLASISIAISVTGSLDLLFAITGLLIAFKKERVFFDKVSNTLSTIKSQILRVISIIIIIVVIVFVGNANKIGADTAVDVFTNSSNGEKILLHTAKRVSVWYVSVLALGNKDVFDNDIAFTTLRGVFDNLYSRANIILEGKKDEIEGVWSVKRMNFLQISRYTYNDRTGTAPGLVASAFYLPFFPFNFFIMGIYTVIMLRYFSKGFRCARYSLNIFSKFVILFFFIGLFDSPIDLINFIGPDFIFILLFLGAMDKIENMNYLRLKKTSLNKLNAA